MQDGLYNIDVDAGELDGALSVLVDHRHAVDGDGVPATDRQGRARGTQPQQQRGWYGTVAQHGT